MSACPRCGERNPERAKFCLACGAAIGEQPSEAPLEERKVVSVLFCDLVGFTAASEQADPEDVRARIRPYHVRLRREIERYGGTVEKFVGDAVMAVFGAPVAHEDDAERAVRAGLSVLEAIEELNQENPALQLQVRVGINTGEAVVALGARPEEGEGIVTGDVVNTASRLQGLARVNEIVCSEQTYRQTERVFDFEELEPAEAKGKAAPLALYRPLGPRARFGYDLTRTHAAPLVGRELEKPLLIGTFQRCAKQRSCQLVTIVGEPGVGKSRLCAELFHYLAELPGLIRWRQGRCLPYGEGIAFWALGEIVKAECGILESDSPDEAAAKLERALPKGDAERVWLSARLAPLVGAPAEPAAQEESFTAWRRFLEALAAERETVLVFEDLHWADTALLAFLEHLADWSEGVPLLLLCTARPELYEQHPTWAAGLRNATTINLAPLTEEETARLIASLLGRPVLLAETQQALLERAGGNPLYAEEFVRLLADRRQLSEVVEEVPESVQALIAARLDTLSQERKSLLQDAAVVGKVFWAGALAEMGGREPREVEQALHELARKELVRPVRTSSMEGEAEYAFWHVLVRDVCYAQIPRAARAVRHRAAAVWLEHQAGERAEDLADVLAHHYLQAAELARAAGQTEEAEELEARAILHLRLAGGRALPLNVASAEASLAKALELAPSGHPEHASLLERWAQAAHQQGRLHEAKDALDQAVALYREQGDLLAAGRALTALVVTLWALGDPRRKEAIAEALALLEAQPPGPELVAAWGELAGVYFVDAATAEAVAAADQALDLAAALDLPEPTRPLGFRGGARCFRGDRGGLEDIHRAIERSRQSSKSRGVGVLYGILAVALHLYEGPEAAMSALATGIEFCQRHGIAELGLVLRTSRLSYLAERGLTEQELSDVASIAEQAKATGTTTGWIDASSVQLRLLTHRGEQHPEVAIAELLCARARESGQLQLVVMAFAAAAQVLIADDRREEARSLLAELEQVSDVRADPSYLALLPGFVRSALTLPDASLAARLVDGVDARTPLAGHTLIACRAQLAEATGEQTQAAALYAEAAERWQAFGNVTEHAFALLGQGRCLHDAGHPDAPELLYEAADLFARMSYRRALAEIEALLGHPAHAASGDGPSPRA